MQEEKTPVPAFVETMTAVAWGPLDIRVWRNRALLPPDLAATHVALQDALHLLDSVPEVHRVLRQDPAVTAYEILDPDGNGEVVYMEWP